jgi:hypothetical protein
LIKFKKGTMASPQSPTAAAADNTTEGQDQKNAEIWSTRLQRELLAMTTDNASEDAKQEVNAVLPPFCTIKEHALDIERGDCTVSCLIDLPPTVNKAPSPKKKGGGPSTTADEKEKEPSTGEGEETTEPPAPIIVTMDVSLQKKADGSVDPAAVSYPFSKPVAVLTSGCSRFPEGSTIKDGDTIDIEMDWTPSLHLTDAFLNVSLKVKECISQGEAFHPGMVEKTRPDVSVAAMMNQAKKLGTSFGTTFSQSLRGLTGDGKAGGPAAEGGAADKQKKNRLSLGIKKKKPRPKASPGEVRIGDEINMLEAPWVDCQGVYSCKAIRRAKFVEEAMAVAAQQLKKASEQEQQQQVSRSSLLNENVDQGDVPDDFGEYMKLQAGGISQVCLLKIVFILVASDFFAFAFIHYFAVLFFY